MKRLLLVHLSDAPLDGSKRVFTPPIGLWSMRTNNAGVEVDVWDENLWDIDKGTIDAVGYSLQFPAHLSRLDVARARITARAEFFGGPSARHLKEPLVVEGPGEDFLAGRHLPFAEIEPPLFQTHEMIPYWMKGAPFLGIPSSNRWMPVETSRGCPNACGFCAIPHLWGAWEARPLEVLDAYFHYLRSVHAIQEIIVIDDNMAVQKERFLAIIELFKTHDLSWSVANGLYNRRLLDEDVLAALKGSRCLYLSLPFEAGNARSAALMNLGRKYLSFDEARYLTIRIRDLGIHTAGQFIIGYPGETEADVRETLRYANSLTLDQRHIHMAMALPGTPMHKTCIENGWLLSEEATYKVPAIETPFLSRARLLEIWTEDRKTALERKER